MLTKSPSMKSIQSAVIDGGGWQEEDGPESSEDRGWNVSAG
jgi:hypothetical protein